MALPGVFFVLRFPFCLFALNVFLRRLSSFILLLGSALVLSVLVPSVLSGGSDDLCVPMYCKRVAKEGDVGVVI